MDWFYAHNGQQAGPVTETALLELSRTGVVTQETLVWREGMAEWKPFRVASAGFETPQRYCNSCGNRFPASELAVFGESAVCAACKPAYAQRLAQGMTTTEPRHFEYAGFWIRFVAYLIDGIIVGLVRLMILWPLGGDLTFSRGAFGFRFDNSFGGVLVLAAQIAYYTIFWTQYGATPGKMLFGLKVVRPDGGPISAGQAIGRYFSYILSFLILCVGFMMAGWDDQKRALHDRICNTRVIRTR